MTKNQARPGLEKFNRKTPRRDPGDKQYQRLLDRAVAAIDKVTDEDSSAFWDAMEKLNIYTQLSQHNRSDHDEEAET